MDLEIADLSRYDNRMQEIILREHILDVGIDLPDWIYIHNMLMVAGANLPAMPVSR